MKCWIDYKEENCKLIDNLGYQAGYYVKVVESQGKEIKVVKRNGRWEKWTMEDRVGKRSKNPPVMQAEKESYFTPALPE